MTLLDLDIGDAMDRITLAILSNVPSAEYCVGLRSISGNSGLHTEVCRGVIAELRERGLIEYHRGLFDEDGNVAGAGYSITLAGVDWVRQREAQ